MDFYLHVSGVSSAGNAWYVFVQFQTIPTEQIDYHWITNYIMWNSGIVKKLQILHDWMSKCWWYCSNVSPIVVYINKQSVVMPAVV